MSEGFTKSGFVRAYALPALWLFAIPACGYLFARHAIDSQDAEYVAMVEQAVSADGEISQERRGEITEFYRANPPSVLCAAGAEGREMLPPEAVDDICSAYTQYGWIAMASLGSVGLGVGSLLLVLLCLGISFTSRPAQYWSFAVGWNALRAASLLQVLLQGFLAVMLSFWVTAFFFERYFVKLIFIVGFAVLIAAFMVIKAIFARPDDKLEVEGEVLPRESSPELWVRIDSLCRQLGTEPPDQIVGGIDDNFFVTEHPVHLDGRVLTGRTLYVSLSLLKRLEKSEADAILAHEMAHFSGGDTTHSKKLSPMLVRYGHYLQALHEGWISRPIYYFMIFYRSVFELSLGRSSRSRELRADRIAAEATSPESIAHSLLKVSAYSSYRGRVEQGLFEREKLHSDLDIAHRVAVGFTEYAHGPRLGDDLEVDNFPHPFDSHPGLKERLANVGVQVDVEQVPQLVVAQAARSWFTEIGEAERIERELWEKYEARFQEAHQMSLAFRYLPATPEEKAHVERYFPPKSLAAVDGAEGLTVDCEQLTHAGWDPQVVPWSAVQDLETDDAAFGGKILTVRCRIDGKSKALKLTLKKLLLDADDALEIIGSYYHRALVARQAAAEAAAESDPKPAD